MGELEEMLGHGAIRMLDRMERLVDFSSDILSVMERNAFDPEDAPTEEERMQLAAHHRRCHREL